MLPRFYYEVIVKDHVTGSASHHRFYAMPRQGDYVRVYGDRFRVVDVEHDVVNDTVTVTVVK